MFLADALLYPLKSGNSFLPSGLEEDGEGEEEGNVLPNEEVCYQGVGLIFFCYRQFGV